MLGLPPDVIIVVPADWRLAVRPPLGGAPFRIASVALRHQTSVDVRDLNTVAGVRAREVENRPTLAMTAPKKPTAQARSN